MYDKPLINLAKTFTEVFPIGLLVALASAGIRRKKGGEPERLEMGTTAPPE